MIFYTQYSSPVGLLTITSNGSALTGLWLETQRKELTGAVEANDLPVLRSVQAWLDGYFQGKPPKITFPLSPSGTEFQHQVWDILLQIPYGKTCTYGEIARQITHKMSAQAVGQAVGRNPISIIIPCHRVIGKCGKLTGYAGGLDKKKWLLHHEEVLL